MKKLTLLAMIVAVAAHTSLFAGDFENIGSAIRTGDLIEVKRLVLEEKIDINLKNEYGRTTLHGAVRWGRLAIIEFLIKSGIDVNAKSNSGLASLMLAMRNSRLDIAKCLIKSGADINIKDEDGWTLLHIAICLPRLGIVERLDIVKYLVGCGVNIGAKDKNGETALDIVREYNDSSEIIAFLEKIEKFTASIENPSTRDFAITTIFTGNKYSSDDKKLFLDIMAGQGYCKALKKVFELGCKTKGLFQELFGKEIMYEDVYKAEICSRFLDNPFVIKNLVSGNYYDATRIYDHYSDKQRMNESSKICLEMIDELKKQQMLNVIMAQRKGSNIFFNFK